MIEKENIMAYASKELKDKVNALIKEVAKEMNVKLGFSIKIENHSKISVNIRSCSIDLAKEHREFIEERYNYVIEHNLQEVPRYERIVQIKNYLDNYGEIRFSKDNPDEVFSGKALELMEKIRDAVKCEYYNDSDVMRDYFDIAYYYDIKIGDSASGFKVV